MNYFEGCTVQDARKRLIGLVKLHHPDRGGNAEVMKLINAQYAELQESGRVFFTNPNNGYDPFSRRRLTATPPREPRTYTWEGTWSPPPPPRPKTPFTEEWEQAHEAFARFARGYRKFVKTSSVAGEKLNEHAEAILRLILKASIMEYYEGLRIEVIDIGTKWATFRIFHDSWYIQKQVERAIRRASKVYKVVKMYQPTREPNYFDGFQIYFGKKPR